MLYLFHIIMHLHLLVLSAWNVLLSCLNLPTSFLLAKLQDVTPTLFLLIRVSHGRVLPRHSQSHVKPLLGGEAFSVCKCLLCKQ